MGEIKSVKVDNWGVFFLQKLQNFFNKTDYCDLTLQFRDNSQLKVHRLVLSACTDYFNVLEHTCEMVDDALIMPNELQADVVVPIVNFMYTGTLEFELKMYGKLLRTAKEMNMTVLLKLLEAHRRTMEGVNRSQRPPSPKTIRRRGLNVPPSGAHQPQQQSPQRRILTTSNASVQPQRRPMQTQTKAIGAGPASTQQFRQQIGSTSLLRSVPSKAQYEQQFKQEPDLDFDSSGSTTANSPRKQPTSPFEQLRKGYNNNKRPTTTTFVSPPAKKPNIEDVKEFAEQQRMRKQIAAEYGGDDPDYEGMLEDDDIHNDDDDDDIAAAGLASSATATATISTTAVQATTSRQTSTQQQLQAGSATITFRQEQNDKPPTIVVKDSSNSKMNHAKIISEVLRQYPHLVKSNKNIKLKIMPNVSGQSQKIVVNKDGCAAAPEEDGGGRDQQTKQDETTSLKSGVKPLQRASHEQQQQPQKVPVHKPLVSTGDGTNDGSATAGVNSPQKRRIDSKTMHALIAQGAENTTGPWLCLRCGVSGRPISIPSYRSFRKHLVNTHKEVIDPLLCELCGWRGGSKRELHFHLQKDHNMNTSLFAFPDCLLCAEQFIDTNALNQHMLDSHPDENKQQCIYCNKIFAKELQLFIHMKTFHKNQAHDDGIIDFSEEEFVGSQDDDLEEEMAEQHEEYDGKNDAKVKILSDISLPSTSGGLLKLEPSSEAAGLSTLASGIATSIGIAAEEYMNAGGNATTAIGPDTKFVNADGNEMLLTEDQRKEIIAQLNQHHDSSAGVIMVLNEQVFAAETAAITPAVADGSQTQSEDGEPEESGDEEAGEEASGEYDDSEIYDELMVESSHATVGRQSREAKKTPPDESKESIEHMEWAENLISAHEMADEADNERKVAAAAEEKAKKDDVISKKLKELTGDWSDDDDEEGDVEDESDEIREEALAGEDVKREDQTEEHVDEQEHGKPAEQQLTAEETEEEEDEEMVDAAESGEREIEEKREDTSIDDAATADAESVDNLTAEEPSVEEDELELAMKSMHKDDLDVKQLGSGAAKSAVQDIPDAGEDVNPKEVSLETPTDLDDEIKTETDANESFEEEFLAVSKQSNETCTQDEEEHEVLEPIAAVDESKEAVAYKSKDDVAIETSKNNAAIETPMNEQISVKAADNEDEAKANVADKPQRAFPIGMPSLDDDDDEDDAVKDAVVDIVDKTLTSVTQQKHTEHDDGTLEGDLNASAVATDKVKAVNETVEDVVTETADAISNKNSNANAPIITIDSKNTATTSTTTGDKVKSLISEWADDDDEDDDEQDTVAIGELVHEDIEDYDEPEQL